MKVLISGVTGLIGSAVKPLLTAEGHQVVGLTRRQPPGEGMIAWDPAAGVLDAAQLAGFDAVVHLAGENIGSRWTPARKAQIRRSRVDGTRLLCERLASLDLPPQVLVCASAIGYYGDRGDEILTEESPPGEGFLAEVCQQWEAATEAAREKGIRVVNLRIGVVLSPEGGALPKMLTPFKLGLGGRIGSGRQYWSWIAREDVAGAIRHALLAEDLSGPVNATAPNPVTNAEFTKALGRVLGRPTVFPLPAAGARLMLGEAADDLLLGSARILPKRLQESNFRFRHPELDEALRSMLRR